MEVGDLVTLSSAGKKNKGNALVLGKMGVIVEIKQCEQSPYSERWPINIRWFNVIGLRNSRGLLRVKRYEIKKV